MTTDQTNPRPDGHAAEPLALRLNDLLGTEVEMETPVFTALNTLKASRMTVMLAKWFGKKRVAHDSGCTVTMHRWRGKWYLTDCKDEVPNPTIIGSQASPMHEALGRF